MLFTIPLILITVGVIFGHFFSIWHFRSKINRYSQAEVLGKMLDAEQESDVSKAYHNGTQVLEIINNISWAVPTVITPFVGYGCKPGTHNNAKINSLQFRSEKELLLPKPSNVYRIFITGGSTAFSSGAPSQDRTIAAYFNRLLSKNLTPLTNINYEVFTMAAPAWASTHERIMIENRLSDLEPDLVVSLSGNNDIHWGAQNRNIMWFRAYDDEFYFDLLNDIYLMAAFGSLPDVVYDESGQIDPATVAKRLEKNIRLSAYALSLRKVPYVFLLQPTLSVTSKKLTQRESQIPKRASSKIASVEYFSECYRIIDEKLSKIKMEDFYYFNMMKIFDEEYNDIFIDSYHFGDRGNEMVADKMYEYLREVILDAKRE
jgi:hypothetical protein